MQIIDKSFTFSDGKTSHFFDIATSSGLSLSLFSVGASIQKIAFHNPDSEFPVNLCSDDLDFYRTCSCYAGATLAPNAGRISKASLCIDQSSISLTPNEGIHQLHGGPHNLSSVIWETEFIKQEYDSVSVGFCTSLSDGVDGYPGNRSFHVSYRLEDSGWLTIHYQAFTDRPTYINMSNHTYWNLSGDFSKPALSQTLTVFANNVCLNNEEHIPTDIIPVARTIFDFRNGSTLQNRLNFQPRNEQLRTLCKRQAEIARGYNHAFVLDRIRNFRAIRSVNHPLPIKKACILSDQTSGHLITLYTDAPALVVYSGGFLDHSVALPDGTHSCPSCAIALEAQDLPDMPHLLPPDYLPLTTPEHPFERTIRIQIR